MIQQIETFLWEWSGTRTGLKVSEKQPTSKEKPERPSENLETQSPERKRRRGTRDFCTALCAESWIIWMRCRYVWKQWQVASCFIILLPLQTSNLVLEPWKRLMNSVPTLFYASLLNRRTNSELHSRVHITQIRLGVFKDRPPILGLRQVPLCF